MYGWGFYSVSYIERWYIIDKRNFLGLSIYYVCITEHNYYFTFYCMQKRFASLLVAALTLVSLSTGTVAQAFSVQLNGSKSTTTPGSIHNDRDDDEDDDRGGERENEREGNRKGRPLQNGTTTPPGIRKGEDDDKRGMRMMIGRNLRGVVTSVGINTIMVQSKQGTSTATSTFTVDVTNAKIFKDKATTTIASILVNDTVLVLGPVTGTSVVATAVYDGKLPVIIQKIKEERQEVRKDRREDRRADRMIGSGVAGIVSAISGNTISVIGRMGTSTATTTYAVDATNAKFYKDKATTTIASIVVGDKVLVEGTVNGTSVTATAIYDGKLPLNGKALGAQAEIGNGEGKGFMGKVSGFFKNLFRFGKKD